MRNQTTRDTMKHVYENVIFLQTNDETNQEAFRLLNDEGEEAAIEFLKQWHYPGEHETVKESSAGKSDRTYETDDGYILTWNRGLGYIGLGYRTEESE